MMLYILAAIGLITVAVTIVLVCALIVGARAERHVPEPPVVFSSKPVLRRASCRSNLILVKRRAM